MTTENEINFDKFFPGKFNVQIFHKHFLLRNTMLTLWAKHGRLHRRQDFQLRCNGRDSFTNLQQRLKTKHNKYIFFLKLDYHSHFDVGALTRELNRQTSDFFARVRNRFGAIDEILFRAAFATDELRQSGHEYGHAFGGGYNFVLLRRPLTKFLQKKTKI